MKKILHKQKLHFLFAFFLFFTFSSVFALEKGEVSSNTSLKNEENESMRIRMGGEFTADITVSACNSAIITYTIKIINITGSPKLRSVMSVIPTDAGTPFNISAVDNSGTTWTNESTSSLLKLTTSTSVLNKNDYLIITFSTPSVTFSPWDITGYTNAGYTSNSVFLSGVLPSVQGPTTGTLTPSPAAGVICSGSVVSAIATAGTGSGPITDKLLYRYDGGAWQPYTSNTALVTAGHTSVDIQTYSFYNSDAGCAPSVPVTVSWTINAQPTSGTLSPSPAAGSVCAGTNVSASATSGAGGAGTITDLLQYRFDGGSWQAYTAGTNLSTTGHNTVDIQTYRTASGSNCTSSTPVIVSWTINQKSADPVSASASSATICSGQSTNLTLNGGGGGFSETIKWYTASCGGTLAGTGNNLSVSPASTTTYYGRYENAAPCNYNSACATVTVTVTTPPYVSTQPVNQTVTYGSPVSFSISATGSTGYQWQENTGSGFVNISNTGIYSGATSATLSLSQPAVSMSGYKYRVIIAGICTPVTSTEADLVVAAKTITVTAEAKAKTYGDADPELTYSSSPLVSGDSFTGSLDRTAGENVGTYAINQNSLALSSNYILNYTGANLSIGTKTITVTAEAKAKTYGDADPALTYTITSGALVGTDSFSGSLDRAAGENVGTYAINQNSLALNSNYILNYTGANLAIGTKTITVTAEAKAKTYGDADPALTYTITSGALVGTDSFSGSLDRAAGENVGTYAINQNTLALNSNYILDYTGANLTIGTKTITVTAEAKAKTYGDADPALTYTSSPLVSGDSFTGSLGRAAGENVGTYAINQNSLALSNNYILNYTGANLTIGTKTITVTAEAKAKTYGDADPALTYTITSGALVGTDSFTGSLDRAAGENVGTYAINQNTLALNSNYILDYTGANLAIGTKTITVTAEAKAKTYGDADPELTYTSSPLVSGDSFTGSLDRAAGENVGTYAINQNTLALNSNYILDYTGANLTIGTKTITVTAEAKAKTYGDADPALTYTSSPLVSGDSFTGSLSRAAGENVGTYAINQNSLALSNNYILNYTGANLSIATKTITVTAEAKAKTYGDADPALTYTITSGALVGTDSFSGSLDRAAGENVGTYAINQNSLALNSNYILNYTGANLTIGTKTITVTAEAKAKTYGDADPELTYTSSPLVSGDSFTGSLDRAAGENVGTYAINQNSLALSSNYILNYTGANLTIGTKTITVTAEAKAKTYGDADPALTYTSSPLVSGDSFTGSLSRAAGENVGTYAINQNSLALSNNYILNYTGANLSIATKTITVTAEAKAKTYGDADPALTYTITSGALVGTDSFSGSLDRAAGENVGTYAINQNSLALNSNYILNYTGANLTIGTKTITVTAEAKAKTYGDADPALTYTITSGALVSGDSFTGSLDRAAGENVGTYAINQNTLALNSNYILNYSGESLTIGKAALVITANNQSKTYGADNPVLTASYSGFINGDTFNSLTTQPVVSTTATSSHPVGTHPITVDGASSPNYIISYIEGILTVNPVSLVLTAEAKAKTYGDADPALTYTITSGALVGTDSFSGSLSRAAGENVGTYVISQNSLALNSNYILNFTGANLTIGTKTITVTAEAKAKTYGDADPALTYTITSGALVSGDSFTGSLDRAAGENVGTYAINQNTLALNSNYILNYSGANLTIGTKTITLTAEAKAKTYGDADPALTYTITSGALVGADSFSGSLSRAAGENVGTYAINQNTLALNSNYILDYTGANLTIGTKTITVTAEAKAKTYGDADPALTYTITSGALVGTDSFSGSLDRAAGENVGTYAINQNSLALNSNYILNYTGANLTIGTKTITVTAEAKAKTYGDADPALTYTSSPLVSGDSFTGSLGRAAGENVGTYAINQNTLALSSNYILNYTGANLTIGTKTITVTAEAKAKTYGDADPALTYTITSGALVSGDSFTGSLDRAAGENVGTYAINQNSLALNSNYILNYTGANLTIGTKTITVTAEAKAKTYGDTDPELTYTSSPLVSGDSFTGSLSRAAGENVGTYAINQNSLALNSNYILNYTGANLSIGTKTITVTAEAKAKTYGDADPALTYTITSGALVGTDSFSGSLDRAAGENVGTYAINQNSLALSSNYILNYTGADLSIGTKTITVTAEAKAKTYGDADPALTYTITSGALVGTDSFTGSLDRAAGENVGTYAINQHSLALSNNYILNYTGANLTIGTKTITVTAEAKAKTYGDADPALTYTSSPLVSGDSFTGSLDRAAGENVGTYAINQNSLALSSNYILNYTGANLTIGTKTITVTAEAKAKTYGDADPELTYTITSGALVGTDSFSGSLDRAAGENVGTYAINQNSLALNSNYILNYTGANLTIGTKTITVTAEAKAKTYGDADPELTYTSSPLVSGDSFTGSLSRAAGENVGTYAINQNSLALNSNYILNYTGANLSIGTKTITVTAEAKAKTYGDADPALTYTITSGALVGTDSFSGSLDRAAGENVGTYAINQNSLALNSNYILNYTGANLSIGTKTITVTAEAKAKTYGDADPALTYTITSGALVGTDSFTGSLDRAAGENVGTYAINQHSLALSNNYILNYTGANLTIGTKTITVTAEAKAKTYGDADPALTYTSSPLVSGDSFTGSLSRAAGENVGTYAINQNSLALNSNYILNYTGANLTIGTKTITVTAEAKAKTYGDADPALTYTITSGALVGTDSFSGSLDRAAGENVGTYAINQNSLALNSNYILNYTGANLTIGTKTITVTAEAKAKTYGDADPALTYTITSGALVGTDSFSGSLDRAAGENVGTYAINQNSLALNSNYILDYSGESLTIGKAALVITANNQSKTYGADNPVLTASYSGFINGDTFNSLTTQPVVSTTATSSHPVGTHPITVDGASSPNYIISYIEGTLTVNPVSLVLTTDNKSKPYGSAFTAFTGTFSGIQNGDNLTATYTSTGSAATATVGTYPIVATLVDPDNKLGNYTVVNNGAVLTVTKASLDLVLSTDNKSKPYGSAFTAFTGTFSGIQNGDNLTATYTSTGSAATATVGTYPIVATLVDPDNKLGNYTVVNNGAVLTVTKASLDLVLSTDNKSKPYGSAFTAFTGTFSGIQNGDNLTATYTSTGSAATANVGTYPIVATLVDPDNKLGNYTVVNNGAVLTVTKASLDLVLTTGNQSKPYGSAFTAFTGTFSGIQNGDNLTATYTSTGSAATAPVGTYPIVATLVDPDNKLRNYNVSNPGALLRVEKAPLTITANNQTKAYRAINPIFTANYSGFVNGDTPGSLLTQPTFSTTALTGSGIGSYPVNVSGASSGNYTISYVDGTLTITPGELILSNSTIDENKVSGTLVGLLNTTGAYGNTNFNYSLVNGNGNTDNEFFKITGKQLLTTQPFDSERKNTYSIRVQTTDNSSMSLEQIFTITVNDVNEVPTINAIADQVICTNAELQTVSLSGISAGPEINQTCTLSVSSDNNLFDKLDIKNGPNGTAQLTYLLKPDANGVANITIRITDNGGTTNGGMDEVIHVFKLTTYKSPDLKITSDKGSSVSKGDWINLTASGGSNYVWADASGIINGQNTEKLTVRPKQTTTYKVSGVNANGCPFEQKITIEAREDFKFIPNNILSPNGDGVNDIWIVKNIDLYPDNEVRIYDRAERVVYTKKGYLNDWDGTYNGDALAEGTYYYIINLGSGRDKLKGFVSIVRE